MPFQTEENKTNNQPERTMNKEQQRKEFEEWASSNTTINLDLELDLELDLDEVGNYYWDISTYAAWESWQAAQKELTEQRDRLAEALRKLTEYDLGDIPTGVVRKCNEALQSLTQPKKYDANEHQSFYP
jgi:hypothetical protein